MRYILLLIPILIVSCSSKPKLYPNEKYQSVGKEIAQSDISDCTARAEEFVGSEKGKQILKGAGSGATVGAVMGGVLSGVFSGNILKGALRGAAVGGAGGAASEAITPSSLKRSFVNKCLRDKGYEVIGWS